MLPGATPQPNVAFVDTAAPKSIALAATQGADLARCLTSVTPQGGDRAVTSTVLL